MTETARSLKNYVAQIKCLIVAPAPHLTTLMRDLMQHNIGASDVLIARNTTDALALLLERRCNLMLLDVSTQPEEAMGLMREIRKGHGRVPRELPIIAITNAATRALVEQLRDVGVNEILALPVTATHLRERLKSVFENPRDWVLSPIYVGPDRRRKKGIEIDDDRRGGECHTATETPAAPNAQIKS